MSSIPARSRGLVVARERYLCARCGLRGSQWHHRRSRAVVDEHVHCPCNGVWLCLDCHAWCHHEPFLARADGFVVSRYASPLDRPMQTVYGLVSLDCTGGFTFTTT